VDAVIGLLANGWVSTIVLAIIGAFFGGVAKKYGKLIKEVLQVAAKYKQVKSKDSPGGADMTPKEKDAFIKEIVEAIQAVGDVVPQKWVDKFK